MAVYEEDEEDYSRTNNIIYPSLLLPECMISRLSDPYNCDKYIMIDI
jgi:hypothetical protein